MADILQFPRERDRSFVWRQASWLADRRGIAAYLVPLHVARIEAAIRDALSRIAAAPGGTA